MILSYMEQQIDKNFTDKVDDLILSSKGDLELEIGLKYLDKQALERGMSFYEIVFFVLYMDDQENRLKEWVSTRSNNYH